MGVRSRLLAKVSVCIGVSSGDFTGRREAGKHYFLIAFVVLRIVTTSSQGFRAPLRKGNSLERRWLSNPSRRRRHRCSETRSGAGNFERDESSASPSTFQSEGHGSRSKLRTSRCRNTRL